jgi:hypothetical protein
VFIFAAKTFLGRQRELLEVLSLRSEASDITDQLSKHHSMKEMLASIVTHFSVSDSCPLDCIGLSDDLDSLQVADTIMRIDAHHLAIGALQMLVDSEKRSQCLSAARDGGTEQGLVDVLHAVSRVYSINEGPYLTTSFRFSIWTSSSLSDLFSCAVLCGL